MKPLIQRRDFLQHLGGGLGGFALLSLLGKDGEAAVPRSHPVRAKRVIQLFMNGGASQMDLFDYKPALFQQHGQKFDPGAGARVEAATSVPGKILKPPFPLRQQGQSGRWISDLLPHLAKEVDNIAFLLAMSSRTNVHGPASYLMNTGFLTPGFPCLGSWVSYALGRLTDDLPAFVALPDPRGLPYNAKGNFTAGFLPIEHQATLLNAAAPEPLTHLRPSPQAIFATPQASRAGLDLLRQLNQNHLQSSGPDPRLEGRLASYELAARLQLAAPEAFDLSQESEPTRKLYGIDDDTTADFGKRCLLARRLVQRGVRFVQVWSGAGGPAKNWDNHANIEKELPPMCAATDKPIAGLIHDLRATGLLDDTLLLWNTEFGRMPFSQGSDGRDHNGGAFAGWMAGAGVKPGVAVGATDDWSWKAASDIVTTYDFHATVLHLLGYDHEKLAVRHNGADRRLTDVHGQVVTAVLNH